MLVTGATNGIGQVTARELARQGNQVVIVGRDPARTAAVAQQIGAAGHLLADLSEMSQVRRATDEFRERFDRLDVLVNNAGAMFQQRRETQEGIEMTWALNHLAPFLLTRELMSLLLVTPGSRVVTVASAAHAMGRIRFGDPEWHTGYNGWAAYSQSKLANILFARELARRGAGVKSYSLHPGMVASGFAHNNGGLLSQGYRVIDRFALSPEQGAQTSLYLATTQDQLPNGAYFDRCAVARPSARALDDGAAARLWQLSKNYVQATGNARSWSEILQNVRPLGQDQ